MRTIEVTDDSDNTVKIGIAKTQITDRAGTRPCDDQVFISISDPDGGEHVAFFTPDQVVDLTNAIVEVLQQMLDKERKRVAKLRDELSESQKSKCC